MTVTLNFTSKGLIDAIQRQLVQQKSEGKINGDISYKNIVDGDFWGTLEKINNSRAKEKKSKIYHGKSYSSNNNGQNTDWTKSVVVYGNVTLDDNEWKTLVEAMGLELTSNGANEENPEESNVQELVKEEPEIQEPTKEEDVQVKRNEDFSMETSVYGVLLPIVTSILIDNGYDRSLCAYAIRITKTELEYNVKLLPDRTLEISNGKTVLSDTEYETKLLEFLANDPKIKKKAGTETNAATDANTETNTETDAATDANTETNTETDADDENCTDDEAE